jgi:hypothetical protein
VRRDGRSGSAAIARTEKELFGHRVRLLSSEVDRAHEEGFGEPWRSSPSHPARPSPSKRASTAAPDSHQRLLFVGGARPMKETAGMSGVRKTDQYPSTRTRCSAPVTRCRLKSTRRFGACAADRISGHLPAARRWPSGRCMPRAHRARRGSECRSGLHRSAATWPGRTGGEFGTVPPCQKRMCRIEREPKP